MKIMNSITFTILISTFVIFIGCFQGPMYSAGMASDEKALGASVTPPMQDTDPYQDLDFWKMEDDIKLWHYSSGMNGKRKILYIHGGPGIPPSGSYPGFDNLTADFQIIYYHQRGSGKSTRPFESFKSGNYYSNMNELVRRLGFRAQVADIERIRILLKEDKLILAGHSFGGFIASLYAAEYPDHVDKLILISPADVVRMPPKSGGLYQIVRKQLSGDDIQRFDDYQKRLFDFGEIFNQNEKSLSDLNNEFFPYFEKVYMKSGFSLRQKDYNPEWTAGWSTFAMYFDLGRKSDFSPFLNKIKAETLLVYGDKDILATDSFSDYNGIKKLENSVLQNAGHFPFNESPNEFSKTIRSFLEK
jgi:proline iminopeptidase